VFSASLMRNPYLPGALLQMEMPAFLKRHSREYTGINPDEGVGDRDLCLVIDAISMTAWSALCK
jgi:hypothetical protein